MHSSKLWPETEVVNYDKMKKYKFDPKNCTKDIFKQYVVHLLFRSLLGLSDLADRNFIIVDNILYSIDEESMKDDLSLENELKKSKYELVLNFIKIKDNKHFLNEKLNEWLKKVKNIENKKFIETITYNYNKNIFVNLVK